MLRTIKTVTIEQSNTVGMAMRDPKAYIDAVLPVMNLTISARGELEDGKDTPAHILENQIHREYMSDRAIFSLALPKNEPKLIDYSKQILMAALEEVKHDKKKIALKALNESLAHNPASNFSELHRYVLALNPTFGQYEVYKAAHVLWQIKRKMNGLPTEFDLVMHLHGPQKTGKTTAIEMLMSPISAVANNVSLDILSDPRATAPLMNENYLIFIDEIQMPDKTHVDTLKRLITGKSEAYRRMHSNNSPSLKKNASLVTASNWTIQEIIKDSSGMRRYFELHVPTRCNWAEIKAIDYTAIYQSVDENKQSGYYYEIEAELDAEQAKLVSPDDMSVFIEEYGLTFENIEDSAEVDYREIYDLYKHFCMESNYRTISAGVFGKRFSKKGFVSRKTSVNGAAVNLYRVNRHVRKLKPFRTKPELVSNA